MSNKHKLTKLIVFKSFYAVALFGLCYFLYPKTSHAFTITPLYKVLGDGDATTNNIRYVWTQVNNLVNVVVIAALIFVAFANILRIQINNYAVKKILPALLLAVILTNFSYFICRFMVDLANVVLSLLMDGSTSTSVKTALNNPAATKSAPGVAGAFDFTSADSSTAIDTANLWKSFIYIVAEFVGAVFVFILSFLFFIRNYVIYFLVGLAPLAFMSTVLPQTKTLFNQWWSQFMRWVFMPIVSVFWLWLGGMWYSSSWGTDSEFNSSLLGIAFAGVCYYMAITTPFKMGGAIMAKWGDLGKKAWGLTGKQALGGVQNAGKMWLAGQAASKNKLNLIGHAARIPYNLKDRKEQMDKELEDRRLKAGANIRLSRIGRKRFQQNLGRGGDMEEADAVVENDYLKTPAGRAWSEGRKAYLARQETLKNQIGTKHTQTDIDFVSGEGDWGKPGTEKYKTREAFHQSGIEFHKIAEALLANKVSKEEIRSVSGMHDMLKRNEDLVVFQRFIDQQKIIDAEKDPKKKKELEDDLEKQKKATMERLGINETQFKENVDAVSGKIKARIQEITKQLTDESGKLIVPYELSFGLELSEDGKSIKGLKGFAEGIGEPSGVRIKKEYNRLIAEEAKSVIGRNSSTEVFSRLKGGGPDYDEEDALAVMSGHPELAKNSEAVFYVQSDIVAIQENLRKLRPDSPEYQATLEALPEFFEMMGERGEQMAESIETDMITRLIAQQPQLFGRITDAGRQREVAEDILSRAGLLKGSMPDGEGGTQPETVAAYYARLSTAKNVPSVEADGIPEFVKLDKDGNPDMEVDGITPKAYEKITSLQNVAKSVAVNTVANDRYVGWRTPMSDSIGFARGDATAANLDAEVNRLVTDLNRAIVGSARGSVEALADHIGRASKGLEVEDRVLIDGAYSRITSEHQKMITSFANQIGLTQDKLVRELTNADKIMLLEILHKRGNKTRAQFEEQLRTVFKDKLKPGSKPEDVIKVPETYRF